MATLPRGLKFGTATWNEGASIRRALVGQLPSDPGRVVDLNRVERIRLTKTGEGRPEPLADALVPASLRLLLESGPRGIQRAAQTLLYADKWHQRNGLPENFAPAANSYALLPCLPRPVAFKNCLGVLLDRLNIQGPMARVPAISDPTLAIVGTTETKYAGCCIAAISPLGPVLGAWLCIDQLPDIADHISVEIGAFKTVTPMDIWTNLKPPPLRPAEVFMLPAPMLRLPNYIAPDERIVIETSFDRLEINYGDEPMHHVVQ
jgi:hypothetical protein